MTGKFLAAGVLLLCATGCRELGLVKGTPHQRYEQAIARSGLAGTALGADWLQAGDQALAAPIAISLPYRESGYFAPDRPEAVGYRFTVRRGQRLLVHLLRGVGDSAQLFMDLFRIPEDGAEPPNHLLSADSGLTGLDLEPERDESYLLRLQPELLRPVRFTITVRAVASLRFPVQGVSHESIKSLFGADRDGGQRRHEGIDIFAPRGTPVLAAAPGRIVEVGVNRLGGNVVWLWNGERNQNLYYAHLDRQLVEEGQQVQRGDILGLVGNTGNARTAPPHLHFGIYRRGEGSVDPFPFVFDSGDRPGRLIADTARLGAWVRVAGRRGLALDSQTTLDQNTLMRVAAGSGSRFRVILPDGAQGFVAASGVVEATTPIREAKVGQATELFQAPVPGAVIIDSLKPGSSVGILGTFAEYVLARNAGNRVGWMLKKSTEK